MSRPHKFWTHRGYLPHFDSGAVVQSVTFRLADSLPAQVYKDLAAQASDEPELRKRIEAMIDEGRGECSLTIPEIAERVREALRHFDGQRYRLLAWVIMPNHVHAMLEQIEGFPLGDIVHSWKSYTGKAANRILGRSGAFWAADYFDRFIRDEAHFQNVVLYIEENPVKAGLTRRAQDYVWSSASGRMPNPGIAGVPPVP